MRMLRVMTLVFVGLVSNPLTAGEEQSALDLFDAMDAGQVNVRFVAADEAHANVLIRNLTDLPLVIQLPDAIAAVPILAQLGQGLGQGFGQGPGQGFGQGFGQGNGQNGGGGGGGNQTVGGNLGQGQGMGQGMGQGLGFMRIPPQKQLKLVASTVCLEHGKDEPNPRVPYRITRLSDYSNDPLLAKLCREVGSTGLSQNTAQAIAWHVANSMSWDKLAKVNSMESRYLGHVRYFRDSELEQAKKWIESATQTSKSVAERHYE